MRLAGPTCSTRFLENCKKYVDAVAREAELREAGRVLDLESFMPLRRNNSAVPLCFSLIEYALGTNLPDEVFEDPNFVKAYLAGVDLVCWSNVSYFMNHYCILLKSSRTFIHTMLNKPKDTVAITLSLC